MFYIDNDTSTDERFDMAIFMEFGDDMVFDSLNSYMIYAIPQLPVIGYYTVKGEEHRPDLLAYNVYGDVQYWWILMWYNHMMKPQDIKSGTVIKYPSLSAIEQLYLAASLKEKTE